MNLYAFMKRNFRETSSNIKIHHADTMELCVYHKIKLFWFNKKLRPAVDEGEYYNPERHVEEFELEMKKIKEKEGKIPGKSAEKSQESI